MSEEENSSNGDSIKSGAADDPFADDPVPTTDQATQSQSQQASKESPATESGSDSNAIPDEKGTFLERRDGAKDGRELIQFFLRPSIYSQRDEHRMRVDAADALDIDDMPGKFDFREALVKVGLQHSDEIADELEEMGY